MHFRQRQSLRLRKRKNRHTPKNNLWEVVPGTGILKSVPDDSNVYPRPRTPVTRRRVDQGVSSNNCTDDFGAQSCRKFIPIRLW